MVTDASEGTAEDETAAAAPEAIDCPSCGARGIPGARFCEVCGALMDGSGVPAASVVPTAELDGAVVAPRPCVRCGGAVADDGYCTECGAPAMSERDHFAVTATPLIGGVCDRGVVHSRNEDALAIAVVDAVAAIVVCDGVSSAPASDAASMAAAEAAVGVLSAGAPGGGREIAAVGAARTSAWAGLLTEAAVRANEAVVTVPSPTAGEAPSCTFVAAAVDGDVVVVASVGDSRAYWLPDEGPGTRLTTDDSWAQEMSELGMPASQVATAPHRHAITRWLGADAPEVTPRTDTVTVTAPGWLLLCSDGLWNYCSDAGELGVLVREHAQTLSEPTATDIASSLVDWVNAQGGRDNVTVALARLG